MLLSPAQRKITEAEYWLQKRGQKELEDINEQIIADGMNPMETTFQTRKQFVRNAVSEISSSAISFEDFQSQLFEKYKMVQIENGTKVPSLSVLVKIANTLSVSADELLLDCLEYSSSSANSEIHRLLLDCNETEQTVIIRTARELKATLVSLGI